MVIKTIVPKFYFNYVLLLFPYQFGGVERGHSSFKDLPEKSFLNYQMTKKAGKKEL